MADTLAAVLERDPDWNALPAEVPPAVRELIRSCLQKDPRERLHDIADARIELNASASPLPVADPAPPRPKGRAVALGIGAAAVLAVMAVLWQSGRLDPAAPDSDGTYSSVAVLPIRNNSENPAEYQYLEEVPEFQALVARWAAIVDGLRVRRC